jgi:Ca-activated chloride channel homolog
MKKIAALLLSFGLFALSVLAQSDRSTRPRVAPTPTPSVERTPPVLQNDSRTQNSAKRPPVLLGGNGSGNQPQNQTGNADEVTEDDGEIIKIETNLVTMPVSVLDRNGRFISGLRQEDFQILENNIPQKIEYFQSVEQPFTVVLLLDVSPSTAYKINEIQDAAITFVNQLRRDDKVIVISFDEKVRVLSQATNNRAVLRNAIMQAQFGDGTSLYEAVDFTINRQLRSIEGRKAVVIFTDGVDTTSRRANYQSTVKQTEELDALIYPIRYNTYNASVDRGGSGNPYPRRRRSGGLGGILADILGGVTINGGNYPSGGGSAGSSSAEYETGRKYLEDLARTSGGRTFEATTTYNLDTAFAGIAEELRRQYAVGYYPEKAGVKGERRSIRVRVMRPNVVVRAKNSYVVGANDNQKFAGR